VVDKTVTKITYVETRDGQKVAVKHREGQTPREDTPELSRAEMMRLRMQKDEEEVKVRESKII